MNLIKKTCIWLIIFVIISAGIWLLTRNIAPAGDDYSQAFPILGRVHIGDGSHATYNSNPPTSGDHYAEAAQVKFYDRELPDEQLVHNLEHGHIWISYKPNLSHDAVEVIKNLSGGSVIATERSENDTDIAVAAWGRLDKFNIESGGLDISRIKDFISRYRNRGPENPGASGNF
jgi:hypothetical protein